MRLKTNIIIHVGLVVATKCQFYRKREIKGDFWAEIGCILLSDETAFPDLVGFVQWGFEAANTYSHRHVHTNTNTSTHYE